MLKIAKNRQNISKCSKIIKIELKCSKSTKNAPKSSKSSSNPPKSRQTLRISAKAAPPSRPRLPSKSLQIHQNLTNPPKPRQNRPKVLQNPPNRAQIPFKPSQIAKFWQSDSLPLPRGLTQNSTWMGSHGERSCGVRSGFVK